MEWEDAGISRFLRRSAAINCILYLAFYFRLVAAWVATAECAAVCVQASYGPGDGLSPCASSGYGNARFVSSASCENTSFFTISVLMHTELFLDFHRLIFVEIRVLGPMRSLTMGHRGGRSIENPHS